MGFVTDAGDGVVGFATLGGGVGFGAGGGGWGGFDEAVGGGKPFSFETGGVDTGMLDDGGTAGLGVDADADGVAGDCEGFCAVEGLSFCFANMAVSSLM